MIRALHPGRALRPGVVVALAGLLAGFPGRALAQGDFTVTLLGTGTPAPLPDRFGPSTLVEAGEETLLFDAGRGAPTRLRQLGVPLGSIDALFLTHYHSDHTLGIPDLWLTGWITFPRRDVPFHVVGPAGARKLVSNLEEAYARDIEIRIAGGLPPAGIATQVEEFDEDGVVYERGGVRVIAFTVDHGAAVTPAVGYRIEYGGRSVVISGDTRYDPNVIEHARGADLLIHEVASARAELLAALPAVGPILALHTRPSEAGRVFALARPGMAAYTHFVLLGGPGIAPPSADEIVAETRRTYDGPLVLGEDLMSFEIGDTVAVRRFDPEGPTR